MDGTLKREPSLAQTRSNKYCSSTDLSNEASVEAFFVLRMLADLGYRDSEILAKTAIQELKVPHGRRKELYKPDFILKVDGKPRWLIDAKAPAEDLEPWTHQCASYSLLINRKYEERPLRFYMLTNGMLARVYRWDQEEPVLSLRFADFVDGNTRYEALRKLLSVEAVRLESHAGRDGDDAGGVTLKKPSMEAVKKAFAKCHRIIWKAEKLSPQAAFLEFAKLLFVKLWEDRRLRDNPDFHALIAAGRPLPERAVRFSTRWIASHGDTPPNPLADILFKGLLDELEVDIRRGTRKRIFPQNERLALSPGTIKRAVEVLEGYYLFGIDEDLNGRMFEAFLTATMRGKALGQYFTPRSIVKLMTRLAAPAAGPDKVERVLDACCGTGGFLIEALTDMRQKVYANTSLTDDRRAALLNEIANEAIFGIDAGRDPPLARIARINMYLHGDGGSRIYLADGLEPSPSASPSEDVGTRGEVEELRTLLQDGLLFDVVLTNPPFSMDYSASVPEEAEILKHYDLAHYDGRRRASLRSMVMFLERYWHLLRPGGRMFTVVDDGILGGNRMGFVRDFIRERFVIRAVISLHGDAFQRAGARAKTSILVLEKPISTEHSQPDIFVYESRYVGLDDVVSRTPASVAAAARKNASDEMDEIESEFKRFLIGEKGPWLVSGDTLGDRLDAKYLRPWSASKLEPKWSKVGAETVPLGDLVEPVEELVELDPKTRYEFLRITYEGRIEPGESRLGREVTYDHLCVGRVGDIVVSNINAVHRAIGVLQKGMEHLLASSEFTILRVKPGVDADPMYLWSVLRTDAVVAEWLSKASGVGRHRVGWDLLKDQMVPLLPTKEQKSIGDLHREALEYEGRIEELRKTATQALGPLELQGGEARERLITAKPPK